MKKSLLLSLTAVLSLNAEVFNVSTTAELRTALSTAYSNYQGDIDTDNTIYLESGVYKTTDDGAGSFTLEHVTLIGSTSGATILDGGTATLVLYANDSTLQNLHVRNGFNDTWTAGINGNNNTIVNCQIYDNQTTSAGYGSGLYGDNNKVINSLFSNNTGSNYGAHIYGGNLTVINSIFVAGESAWDEGIYPSASSAYENVHNNVFIASSFYDRFDRVAETLNTTYGDLSEMDNVFVDFESGNYQPKVDSILIDAGSSDTNGTILPATDMAGNLRINGAAIDIGPYEYTDTVAAPTAEDILNNPNAYGLYTQEQMDAAVAGAAKPVIIVW